ncbi:MAG: YadA-like family protein [Pseudomonadota bacterium]
MRYFLYTGLLIGATAMFGQLVSGSDELALRDKECVNCGQATVHPAIQSKPQEPQLDQTGSIFFTQDSVPVRLVSADQDSSTLIPISYQDIYDTSGKKIAVGDRQVVSVQVLQAPKAVSAPPKLTVPKPASSGTSAELYSLPEALQNKPATLASVSAQPATTSSQSVVAPQPQQNEQTEHKTTVAPNDVAAGSNQLSQGSDDGTSEGKRTSRLKKIALYGVPAAVTVAALTRSNNSNDDDMEEPTTTLSKGLVFKSSAPLSSEVASDTTTTDDSGSSDSSTSTDSNVSATDLVLSGQINDVENEVNNLTTTVNNLSDEVDTVKGDVSTAQNNISTLEGQLSGVQGQLGDNNVDALVSQLKDLESKTYAGIASAASLVTAIPSEPGKTILNIGSGYYEGETAVGVSMSRRMTKVNGYVYSGVASGISEIKSPLVRVGVGIEF